MSSNTKKRSALGKGLSALLEGAETDITSNNSGNGIVGSISNISISSDISKLYISILPSRNPWTGITRKNH